MNQAQTISPTTYVAKPKKGLRRFVQQHLTGILMILPFLVLFAVFVVVPVGRSLYLSFTEYNAIGAPKWVGLENFTALFQDARFYKALFNLCGSNSPRLCLEKIQYSCKRAFRKVCEIPLNTPRLCLGS